MSKFSNFERIPRDLYETLDSRAIPPNFLKHITGKRFYEPSCGSGKLIDHLKPYAECVGASDIVPLGVGVEKDALELSEDDLKDADCIITNPVYKKDLLLPLISHLSSLRPTWLLLPAGFAHTGYAKEFMRSCTRMVNIGRLYWFENKWEVKVPFDYSELDPKWDKQVEFFDSMKGIKYYTGYVDTLGRPNKSKYVRGTDDYCWYLFLDKDGETVYETRGD